jgi:hypothetical protein
VVGEHCGQIAATSSFEEKKSRKTVEMNRIRRGIEMEKVDRRLMSCC